MCVHVCVEAALRLTSDVSLHKSPFYQLRQELSLAQELAILDNLSSQLFQGLPGSALLQMGVQAGATWLLCGS